MLSNSDDSDSGIVYSGNKIITNNNSKIGDSSYVSANLLSKTLENLDSRLATCNEVYKIAVETNNIKDRDRNNLLKSYESVAEHMNNRVERLHSFINQSIAKSRKETSKDKEINDQRSKINTLINSYEKIADQHIITLSNLIEEHEKSSIKVLKNIKSQIQALLIREDDSQNMHILEQKLADVQSTQDRINAIMSRIQSKN